MQISFLASTAVISSDPGVDGAFFAGVLGLPLHPAEDAAAAGYVYTEELGGSRHFGVWPLADAAQACFGSDAWPATHPVPQASLEFEVATPAAVDEAAGELTAAGHVLLHPPRTEPWEQRVVRVQRPDGVVVGVCFTPWMH